MHRPPIIPNLYDIDYVVRIWTGIFCPCNVIDSRSNLVFFPGLGKYGVYSLFPGGPSFGSALYSHASTIGRFASGQLQQTSGNTFHAAHKGKGTFDSIR